MYPLIDESSNDDEEREMYPSEADLSGDNPPRRLSGTSTTSLTHITQIKRLSITSKSMSVEASIRHDAYKNQSQNEIPALLAHVNVAERASFYSTEGTVPPPTCPYCLRMVYSVEELHAVGYIWHKSCFVCGGTDIHGCSRIMGLDNFVPISGVPYCKACSHRQSITPVQHSFGKMLERGSLRNSVIMEDSPRARFNPGSFVSREFYKEDSEDEEDGVVQLIANPLRRTRIEEALQGSDEILWKNSPISNQRMPRTTDDVPIPPSSEKSFDGNSSFMTGKTRSTSAAPMCTVSTSTEWTRTPKEEEVVLPLLPEVFKTTSRAAFKFPFDGNGVLYFIGTKNGTAPYRNPHLTGTIKVTANSGKKFPAHLMVEHCLDPNMEEGSYGDNNWVSIDLGEGRTLLPTRYCVRQKACSLGDEPGVAVGGWGMTKQHEKPTDGPHWILRGRANLTDPWTVLHVHKKDQITPSTKKTNSTVSWLLRPSKYISWAKEYAEKAGYRYFLIVQCGVDPLKNNNGFSICGVEFYGLLKESDRVKSFHQAN